MKRHIEGSSWLDGEISRPLNLVLGALDGISKTWPCAKQVRGVINSAIGSTDESPRNESPHSFDLMTSLTGTGDYSSMNPTLDFEIDDVALGNFMPDAFYDGNYQWNDGIMQDPSSSSVNLFEFETSMP